MRKIQDYFSCRFSFNCMLKVLCSLRRVTNQGAHCFSPQVSPERSTARLRTPHKTPHVSTCPGWPSPLVIPGTWLSLCTQPPATGSASSYTGRRASGCEWPCVCKSLNAHGFQRAPIGPCWPQLGHGVTPLEGTWAGVKERASLFQPTAPWVPRAKYEKL